MKSEVGCKLRVQLLEPGDRDAGLRGDRRECVAGAHAVIRARLAARERREVFAAARRRAEHAWSARAEHDDGQRRREQEGAGAAYGRHGRPGRLPAGHRPDLVAQARCFGTGGGR